jgi:tetratricopeptide (TPR) repeat protein
MGYLLDLLLIRNEFELKHPDDKRFGRLLNTYYETFNKLNKKVEAKPETAEKRILEKAVKKAILESTSWWAVELEAAKYKRKDQEKADEIYQEGLKKFPNEANLLGNYANFLTDIRKDHEKAEEYYKKALEADPTNANNLGNYQQTRELCGFSPRSWKTEGGISTTAESVGRSR